MVLGEMRHRDTLHNTDGDNKEERNRHAERLWHQRGPPRVVSGEQTHRHVRLIAAIYRHFSSVYMPSCCCMYGTSEGLPHPSDSITNTLAATICRCLTHIPEKSIFFTHLKPKYLHVRSSEWDDPTGVFMALQQRGAKVVVPVTRRNWLARDISAIDMHVMGEIRRGTDPRKKLQPRLVRSSSLPWQLRRDLSDVREGDKARSCPLPQSWVCSNYDAFPHMNYVPCWRCPLP